MGFSKNFRVRNGLEVTDGLFVADGDLQRVGIGTTNPTTLLDIRGTTTSNNVVVSNQLRINGTVSIGNSVGSPNQYLISTGTGVTWTTLPGLRNTITFTATEGQTVFNFAYNVSVGVDVYVNGVKLTPTEYTANDGSTIVLDDPAYAGDTVDIIAYSVAALAVGSSSATISVLEEGGLLSNSVSNINFTGPNVIATGSGSTITVVSTASSLRILEEGSVLSSGVTNINFVGPNVVASGSGSTITVTSTGFITATTLNVSGVSTFVGFSTFGNVQVGGASTFVGFSTFNNIGVSSIITSFGGFISVANTTPIRISLSGNRVVFTAVGIGSTSFILG